MVDRLLEILRLEGTAGIIMRILARLGYRRVGWYHRLLSQPIADLTGGGEFHVVMLTVDDLADYLVFRPSSAEGVFEQRYADGYRCFAVRHEGAIISASWAATGRAWCDELICWIELQPDEVYLGGSTTLPAYRGQRLHALVTQSILEHYLVRGLVNAVGMVASTNRPSINSQLRSGWCRTATITQLRIGNWHKEFFHGERHLADRN